MKIQGIENYNDIFEYIKTNNILNVDIRFLDSNFNARSFTLNAKHLSKKIFTSKYFKFNTFYLLAININRCFKDPFLTQPTLVFFTNLYNHKEKICLLKQQTLTSPYFIDFYINSNNNNYSFSIPSMDNNRIIRDEIISALNTIYVKTTVSFNKENGGNIIGLQCKNKLELLDSIEKVKYVILMVANVFNAEIILNKGIFIKPNLLLRDQTNLVS